MYRYNRFQNLWQVSPFRARFVTGLYLVCDQFVTVLYPSCNKQQETKTKSNQCLFVTHFFVCVCFLFSVLCCVTATCDTLMVTGDYPGNFTANGTYRGKLDFYNEDNTVNLYFELAISRRALTAEDQDDWRHGQRRLFTDDGEKTFRTSAKTSVTDRCDWSILSFAKCVIRRRRACSMFLVSFMMC